MTSLRKFIKLSAEKAYEMIRPTKQPNGKWYRPLISTRRANIIRKHAVKNSLVGTWVPGVGGWLEEWDRPLKHHVMRPPKEHIHDRKRDERIDKIQKAMEDMPRKIEEYRKMKKESKPLTGFAALAARALKKTKGRK